MSAGRGPARTDAPPEPGAGRGGPLAWLRDLALGARLSVAGGRSGWARLAMISVGVGLGVAVLLGAAALPSVATARAERAAAQSPGPEVSTAGADTLLTARIRSEYRDVVVTGRLVQPEGPRAPLPPGVDRQLSPGELVVSPAVAALLDTPEGALLRDRWGGRVAGTIGPSGLTGPADHTVYVGTDQLSTDNPRVTRVDSFGDAQQQSGPPSPVLLTLTVVGLVALLLPVMVFVTTAVRFGSEARDRQLAAIRLVGADAAATRRVAAGETLVGALLGMAIGGLLFVVAGRWVGGLLPPAFSFFPSDLRPVPALLALVVLLVPSAAVLVTLSALRRVVIEPLGVVRRSGERRRRLWWRLLPPAAGAALLYPALDGGIEPGGGAELQLAAALVLLLAGVVLVLPWLVQASVRRLTGGGVAWQLAVRRLQLDSGTAVRAVSGIAVSVAGVIAVHGLFTAAAAQIDADSPPADRFQAVAYLSTAGPDGAQPSWPGRLAQLEGVRATSGVSVLRADDATVRVGDCVALRQYAQLPTCDDGDTFVVGERPPPSAGPGTTVRFDDAGAPPQWTVPAGVRAAAPYDFPPGEPTFLVTPAAFGTDTPEPEDILVALDPADPAALERLRNAVTRADPFAFVSSFSERQLSGALADVQQALLVGAVVLLLVVGASMLVNVLEQLRERRRVLAVLAAFGIRRATLSGSVLYQVAIPVVLGVTLAAATAIGLTVLLQAMVDIRVRLAWPGIAAVSGAAAGTVLAVTAASLPPLWRLTRPDGLRSE